MMLTITIVNINNNDITGHRKLRSTIKKMGR